MSPVAAREDSHCKKWARLYMHGTPTPSLPATFRHAKPSARWVPTEKRARRGCLHEFVPTILIACAVMTAGTCALHIRTVTILDEVMKVDQDAMALFKGLEEQSNRIERRVDALNRRIDMKDRAGGDCDRRIASLQQAFTMADEDKSHRLAALEKMVSDEALESQRIAALLEGKSTVTENVAQAVTEASGKHSEWFRPPALDDDEDAVAQTFAASPSVSPTTPSPPTAADARRAPSVPPGPFDHVWEHLWGKKDKIDRMVAVLELTADLP